MRRAVLLNLVLFALLFPIGASAQAIVMETMAINIWGRPSDPGEQLDPYDPLLAEKVDTWLLFTVAKTSEPLDTTVFGRAQREIATDALGAEATELQVNAPALLDGSTAYLAQSDGLTTYFILAYQDDFMYMMMIISSGEASEAIEIVNNLASATLAPGRKTHSPSVTEGAIAGFAADFAGSYERPLSRLPGRGEVPVSFQLIDEEFLELQESA